MNRWMDGLPEWRDGCGWMGEWMDGWMDKQANKSTDVQIDRQTDRPLQIDRQTDEYGFDQQRLIWYVCRLWDMVFS